MSTGRQILKWLGLLLFALVIVVGGTLAGWRVAHGVTESTAIGRVSIQVQPSWSGDVEGFIPVADWGVRANAFDAPLRLRAELRSINRLALLRAANGDQSVVGRTESDLRKAARDAIVRALIWGASAVLLMLLLATLLWRGLRPRWTLFALGVPVLLLVYGATGLRLQSTFNSQAFESPTYFAKGSEIGKILDLATDTRIKSQYGTDYSSIVESISTVLGVGEQPATEGRVFYAGSDLHGNALVINPVSQLVGDHPLLLTGDYGQRGGPVEIRLLAPRIGALSRREVAVSGNHDTSALMQSLSDEGVTVLGQKGRLDRKGKYVLPPVIKVDGLTIAGYRDPLEYTGNSPGSAERSMTAQQLGDPAAAYERWHRDLLKWFTSLPRPPAVLMVHQNGLAQTLARQLQDSGFDGPLTIVTGHDHKQHVDRYGKIVVVDGGTLGASGIFGAGRDSIGIARLSFTGTDRLDSVDLIAAEPVSGAAKARRVVIDSMCPGETHCRVGSDDSNPDENR